MQNSLDNVKVLEIFSKSKDGIESHSGDAVLVSENYLAVIDGATPKGTRLWNGQKGDAFVSEFIKGVIEKMPSDLLATEAIAKINDSVREIYIKYGTSYEELLPEERLQASLVIYSVKRREIWSFGDCKFKVNTKNYDTTRHADKLLSDLRALYTELARIEGKATDQDVGREAIMPLLKKVIGLANAKGTFGYDAINGGPVNPKNTEVIKLNEGDFVVLASDGYPELFDTLEKTENNLFTLLKKDPNCINELRSTKGLKKGNESYDDRSYVSFYVN